MCKRLPSLNSLRFFESAASHLSFTKAAEELFVTQAAVSHQIKLLEDFLGFSLFKRKIRGLELTEKGAQYYQEISPLLAKLSVATEKIMHQDHLPLTISVPQSFGIYWLVPRLAQFNQRYPNIDIRIKGVDQDEGKLPDEIDIGIYYGAGNWDNLQVNPLCEGELVILASPALLAEKPITEKQDLAKHSLIHIHTRQNWQLMLNHLQLPDINYRIGYLFSHTFMALQAAIHSQGVVLANQILAEQEIKQGHLQFALPASLPDSKAFYVVNHINKGSDPRVLAFRNWLIEQFNK